MMSLLHRCGKSVSVLTPISYTCTCVNMCVHTHTHTHTHTQLNREEAARNEVEAKLNAASETLDEKEKQFNATVAQKDAEIYRLSEHVRSIMNIIIETIITQVYTHVAARWWCLVRCSTATTSWWCSAPSPSSSWSWWCPTPSPSPTTWWSWSVYCRLTKTSTTCMWEYFCGGIAAIIHGFNFGRLVTCA